MLNVIKSKDTVRQALINKVNHLMHITHVISMRSYDSESELWVCFAPVVASPQN